ncbi:MAG: glutamine--fructose-6-phosphate transaminase (isomerizing) [Staphylothermus sp.]|nr:glutamine--fructose-6-phosphate transaminase (isomerizing) [Staphylothermus sp.]
MCGIIGIVVANKNTQYSPGTMVYRGLLRLEYRGYDSAGVASICDNKLVVLKGKGRIIDLERKLGFSKICGSTVIGHTRWATHGAPSDINAHPHTDCSNRFAVVHNGIIQNYLDLKKSLISKGHVFRSDTDTEVVAHLVEDYYNVLNSVYDSFKQAVKLLEGSYALLLISIHEPDKIFFAKKDSPLIIGLGNGFNVLASDIPALLEYTKRIITVRDGWIGYISGNSVYIEDFDGNIIDWSKYVRIINWSIGDAVKAGYPHYMLKEIHEQPRALKDTFYGVSKDENIARVVDLILDAEKVFITGAGTSFHASYYFALASNILAGVMVYPFIASEFESYAPVVSDRDLLIVVSQSGETMDALKALRAFKERGAKIVAVSNVVDSAIPRESDIAIYTRAGPEIGVAATKTFTTQTLALAWVAVALARSSGRIGEGEVREYFDILGNASKLASETISITEYAAKRLSEWLHRVNSAYYLSRWIGVPVAMEGALKLKEIAYIHAESYPAGESKHGPIALVEEDFPVIFVVPNNEEVEKLLLGNIKEMKARGAVIIGVAPEESSLIDEMDYVFTVPRTHWLLTPITHTPPQQLLAYYTAVRKGYDPDKPRNLAKTVTVE